MALTADPSTDLVCRQPKVTTKNSIRSRSKGPSEQLRSAGSNARESLLRIGLSGRPTYQQAVLGVGRSGRTSDSRTVHSVCESPACSRSGSAWHGRHVTRNDVPR